MDRGPDMPGSVDRRERFGTRSRALTLVVDLLAAARLRAPRRWPTALLCVDLPVLDPMRLIGIWLDREFDISTACEWHAEDFDPTEARGWLDLHEMTAEDAADYKAQGYTLDNPPSCGRLSKPLGRISEIGNSPGSRTGPSRAGTSVWTRLPSPPGHLEAVQAEGESP
jgi:hypothetical protein